jgi:hypothetical protein
MNDFRATASYLLPYNPVSKKWVAGSKRGVEILDTTGMETSTLRTNAKVTSGKTGVKLCFYKSPKCGLLEPDQKKELKEWRDAQKLACTHNNGGGGGLAKKPRTDSKRHKKWIASAAKAAIEKKANDTTVGNTAELDFKNYIWSLMASKQPSTKAAIAASVETPKPAKLVTLQSILRKVSPKNKG